MSHNKDEFKSVVSFMNVSDRPTLRLQPNEQLFYNKFAFYNEYRQQQWTNTK